MVTHLSGPDVEAAVVVYGVNVLLASLCLSLLMFYIASERSLVIDGVADETLEAKVRQRWVVIGLNVAAIALAVVAPLAAVGVYLFMTLLALALPLIHLRRRPALRLRGSALNGPTGTVSGPRPALRCPSVPATPSGSRSRPARIHTSAPSSRPPTLDHAFERWCLTVEGDRQRRWAAAFSLLDEWRPQSRAVTTARRAPP